MSMNRLFLFQYTVENAQEDNAPISFHQSISLDITYLLTNYKKIHFMQAYDMQFLKIKFVTASIILLNFL
jgi:hypothetical protein